MNFKNCLKLKEDYYFKYLDKLYDDAPEYNINGEDKIVIFSDLHIGDKGNKDDFLQNSEQFKFLLDHYYYQKGFNVFLNGDVEELYKYSIDNVISAWKDIYNLFDNFNSEGRLQKIIGNHDFETGHLKKPAVNRDIKEAIRLNYHGNKIFVYHGHQTAGYIEQYNKIAYYLVRYIVHPLGIKNPTTPIDSAKKYKTEIRAYRYSARKKIISILGHTHRPLFESMSKIDSLTMLLEKLLRKYSKINGTEKQALEKRIKRHRQELEQLYEKDAAYNLRSSLYNDKILVPCLFNTGSVIGKRGMTCIEINKGNIALVYWFDRKRSQRYINYKGVKSKQFSKSNYYKAILKRENLEYVFSRINLLA